MCLLFGECDFCVWELVEFEVIGVCDVFIECGEYVV